MWSTTFQELRFGHHHVNDRYTVGVGDHPNFKRARVCRRADEHRHTRIVGFEGSPVMAYRVQHVV
jgi:hypothetical protein